MVGTSSSSSSFGYGLCVGPARRTCRQVDAPPFSSQTGTAPRSQPAFLRHLLFAQFPAFVFFPGNAVVTMSRRQLPCLLFLSFFSPKLGRVARARTHTRATQRTNTRTRAHRCPYLHLVVSFCPFLLHSFPGPTQGRGRKKRKKRGKKETR